MKTRIVNKFSYIPTIITDGNKKRVIWLKKYQAKQEKKIRKRILDGNMVLSASALLYSKDETYVEWKTIERRYSFNKLQ